MQLQHYLTLTRISSGQIHLVSGGALSMNRTKSVFSMSSFVSSTSSLGSASCPERNDHDNLPETQECSPASSDGEAGEDAG